ncbi:hypothetical protein [Methylobacterium sp. Leaf118]|uniref:hypothetical protein n=1 Tax=Methylobacterium sp. Leaf118 TaxID=2876562 RepID=UPI001E5F8E7F|nr:hypothetical protein [Methylobacterium sp. Leaf118]
MTIEGIGQLHALLPSKHGRKLSIPTVPKVQERPADAIGNAVKVMRITMEEEPEDYGPAKPDKSEDAAEKGRKGAAVRSTAMTPERLAEIAQMAASKRRAQEYFSNIFC